MFEKDEVKEYLLNETSAVIFSRALILKVKQNIFCEKWNSKQTTIRNWLLLNCFKKTKTEIYLTRKTFNLLSTFKREM